jgi:uncharacterized protein YeaO (DUF488 family)
MKELCSTKRIRDLAPSKELLDDYIHRGISQEEYTERFNPEISSSPKAQEALAKT